jgi:hypothetical protein
MIKLSCLGFLLCLWLCQVAQAILTNFTIDDSSPDPRTGNLIVYDPPGAWNTGTYCSSGPGRCTAIPDKESLNAGTWHESSVRFRLTFSLTFKK